MGYFEYYKKLSEHTKKNKWTMDGSKKTFKTAYNKLSFNSRYKDMEIPQDKFILLAALSHELNTRNIPFLSNQIFLKKNYFGEIEQKETISLLRLDTLEAYNKTGSSLFDTREYKITSDILSACETLQKHAKRLADGKKQKNESELMGL